MIIRILAGIGTTVIFTPLWWSLILLVINRIRAIYPDEPFINDAFDAIEQYAWVGGLAGGMMVTVILLPFLPLPEVQDTGALNVPVVSTAATSTVEATSTPAWMLPDIETNIPDLENMSDVELMAYIDSGNAPWTVWEESYHELAVNGIPVSTDQVAVNLNAFPRPPEDNGRGIHWIPTTVQSPETIDRFLPELQAMHIRWVVILNGLNDWDMFGNDYLVQQLVAAGVEPVMRLESRVTPLDTQRVEAVVKHYLPQGVHYYQIYNEPNLVAEWSESGERSPERYAALWAEAATVVLYAGGLPGLAALSPSGDASDYDYLARTLSYLIRAQRFDLLNRSWLSVHNYTGGAPADFVGDAIGFGRYRRYADICRAALGTPLPMIGTEGGPVPSSGAWQASVTDEQVAKWMVAAYTFMQTKREPYFLAYSPWLLANAAGGGTDTRWESAAWFKSDNSPRAMVRAVKGS